jgi:SAM-dependent methyltransferase
MLRVAYAVAVSLSSALLFVVQPAIAKAALPRFGGTAGVWVTCMLFFQTVLLLGYLYAYALTRLRPSVQVVVHLLLLTAAGLTLPWANTANWSGAANRHPVPAILQFLAFSVGLPYFALSTHGPLLQSWYAREKRSPYGLFAWSNFASLGALLLYPIAIEPALAIRDQLRFWSVGFVILCLLIAVLASRERAAAAPARLARSGGWPIWIVLAACSSTLWLAVVNHLTQKVAAIPFLWVLPLAVYLLSFVLCFDRRQWYSPRVFRVLLPMAWIAMGYRMSASSEWGLTADIAVFLGALLVCCMFCHGELARSKPEGPGEVAFFYLTIALGGAAGAIFVSLVGPAAFSQYLELPIGVTGCVLLGLSLLFGFSGRRILRLAVVGAIAFVLATRYTMAPGDVYHARNFYGALQVVDRDNVRYLYNGRTLHGLEVLSPGGSRIAAAYYGPESGIARVLSGMKKPARRIAIVGLGTGTLAAYSHPGDLFRFYEINPAVVDVARRDFHYLAQAPGRMEVVLGDGRLAMSDTFDAIVLDAFSDDSIPVHLLTTEAFQLWARHLNPGGALVVHVTNRYLDLSPVVDSAARSIGRHAELVRSAGDRQLQTLAADWMIVRDGPASPGGVTRLWTDARSNLFQILK